MSNNCKIICKETDKNFQKRLKMNRISYFLTILFWLLFFYISYDLMKKEIIIISYMLLIPIIIFNIITFMTFGKPIYRYELHDNKIIPPFKPIWQIGKKFEILLKEIIKIRIDESNIKNKYMILYLTNKKYNPDENSNFKVIKFLLYGYFPIHESLIGKMAYEKSKKYLKQQIEKII